MPKTIKNFFIIFLVILLIIGVLNILGVPKFIMESIYPKKYYEYVEKYAEEYGVDPLLVFAVIKAESNFDEDVVSNSNAKGIMQLMDTTAEEVAGSVMSDVYFESDMLFDVDTNIRLGTKYLSDLINKYGNYQVAIAAYNAGIGTVDKWISEGIIEADGSNIEKVPYKETNNYVRKIIRDYGIYMDLYI